MDRRRAAALAPEDAEAIERYRYLLRTAPPTRWRGRTPRRPPGSPGTACRGTPPIRRIVASRGAADARSGDPGALARRDRAEVREPGYLERTSARRPGHGGGFGGFGSSLLGSLAGSFIGTAIASQFLRVRRGLGRPAGLEQGSGGSRRGGLLRRGVEQRFTGPDRDSPDGSTPAGSTILRSEAGVGRVSPRLRHRHPEARWAHGSSSSV
jgi:hypothetical protein